MALVNLCQLMAVIRSDCALYHQRSSTYLQLDISSLRAAKLFDIDLTNKLPCHIQCISIPQCYYLTIDTSTNTCTVYNQGSTIYNTTNLLTYMLKLTLTKVLKYCHYTILILGISSLLILCLLLLLLLFQYYYYCYYYNYYYCYY